VITTPNKLVDESEKLYFGINNALDYQHQLREIDIKKADQLS
jgi:hypothetical protein